MKLESLNNEKFKLANNDMGALVGGAITKTVTTGGNVTLSGKNESYSADCRTVFTGADIINGDFESTRFWRGDNDSTSAQNYTNNAS